MSGGYKWETPSKSKVETTLAKALAALAPMLGGTERHIRTAQITCVQTGEVVVKFDMGGVDTYRMPKCKCCGKEIMIAERVYRNMESYQNRRVLAQSECCGIGIVVGYTTIYQYDLYEGGRTADDWGSPIKRGEAK